MEHLAWRREVLLWGGVWGRQPRGRGTISISLPPSLLLSGPVPPRALPPPSLQSSSDISNNEIKSLLRGGGFCCSPGLWNQNPAGGTLGSVSCN